MRKEMKVLILFFCLIAPTLAMHEEPNHFRETMLFPQEHENLQPLLVVREPPQPSFCEEFMRKLRRFRDDYCCSICVGSSFVIAGILYLSYNRNNFP